jgi:peptide/nickel transport system substrate-binding protein
LASCGGAATTTEPTSAAPTSAAPTTAAPTSAAPTSAAPTSAAPTAAGDWWDKFGEPQYGGMITYRLSSLTDNFDPWVYAAGDYLAYYENLVGESWTVSPDESPIIRSGGYCPVKYAAPDLAESWEISDSTTVIFHIREGVYWQDKAPTNGREFTADDVVYHYDRILGTGHGFTTPSPYAKDRLKTIESMTATDDHTVTVKFKSAGLNGLTELRDQGVHNLIEPRETVEAGIKDWHNVAGTGAWMLTDYVNGTSVTLSKNPNYWGTDERYPGNKLPYAETLKAIVIPDVATALAALRTGKIDAMTGIAWQQAQSLAKTNSALQQAKYPALSFALDMRVDKAPFTDIKVRKALQMALDLPTIAKAYYGGTADEHSAGLFSPIAYKGIVADYSQWPKELQDEYTYNLDGAKKLLADAGLPNGFETEVVIANTADLNLMQGIQAMWKDIGVNAKITTMDYATYRAYITAMKHGQMAWMGFGFTWPPNIVTTAKTTFNKTSNFTGHSDTNFDALCRTFDTAASDEEAAKIMADIDIYYLQQHWTVNTVPSYTFNMWQPYLKGYDGEGIGYGQWRFWARYWIDQKLKESM